ncbi:hypothetical protein KIW84_075890 [Lathyrus oleraceus]|uniref:Uncharacterized protein n=1 Tax=Pisum sativum TaxID=3888 RepID=A0A9D4VWH8_PEA|nr:hypothetical protein KIW84_075890 [Pisum sativum]
MAVFHINVFLLLSLLTITIVTPMNGFKPLGVHEVSDFNRSSFPKGFVFGTASSAYQYEGAAFEGGKGPSIWDNFTHKYPEGKLSGGVNPEGIKYYNNLINELLAKGLQPYVTLFHWDVPHALEDEYGGFLKRRIVDDFRDYAELCFKEFGDRVKHWITINEPWSVSMNAYAFGKFAPGRCSDWLNLNCTGGDSGTEPYLTAHNQLLAHSAAANLYRIKYKSSQRGIIGITLISHWYEPATIAKADVDASKRGLDFMFGWYMNPLTRGEYPKSMRTLVGKRLPKFSKEESRELKGSFDFLGLNYYSSYYAADAPHLRNAAQPAIQTDSLINATFEHNGKPLGPMSASSWLCIYPKGLHNLLLYTKKTYKDPVIYITENGNTSYFIRYIVCIIL